MGILLFHSPTPTLPHSLSHSPSPSHSPTLPLPHSSSLHTMSESRSEDIKEVGAEYEPDDKEYQTVASLAISLLAVIVAVVGLALLPDLGKLRITSSLSISIFVLDCIVYGIALLTGSMGYYYSNYGSWEKRYSGLRTAKNANLASALLVSAFSIWRLLTVFIHCQRATDEQQVANDAACWENFDSIVASVAFQFVGAFLLILCLFALAFQIHRRRLDIHDAFALAYANQLASINPTLTQ